MDARLMLEGQTGLDVDLPPLVKLGDIVAPGAPTEGLDLRLERQQAIAVAARDQKICSRFGKGARHMLAEPPARTSDDGDSAAEIKQTVSHETSPGRRTTFITLGSRACKRSNQRGPSSSGAIAVMRFFT